MADVTAKSPPIQEVETSQNAPSRSKLADWFLSEIRWGVRVLLSSGDRFYWDNGFSKAASLAYTTLFSIVPMMVFGFGLLASLVLSDANLLPSVRDFIFSQFMPGLSGVELFLGDLTTSSQRILEMIRFEEQTMSTSVFMLVFLVVSCLLLINSIEYALNEVWQVHVPRTIPQRLSIFCTLLVLAPVFAISAFYANRAIGQQLHNTGAWAEALDSLYVQLLPFFIDFLAFTALYSLVPKTRVRMSSAVFGAFIAALLFDLAKWGFQLYILQYSSYEKVYGTIAAVLIFLFWLYLSWTIVLFGAELSYQAQHLPKYGKVWKRSVMAVGDGILLLSLQALVIVARAYSRGDKLPNELAIAESLGCSTVVLRPALQGLRRSGIISGAEGEDDPLALAKAPDRITLSEIRDALFRGRSAVHYPQELSIALGKLAAAKSAETTTLADLIADDTNTTNS